MTRLQVPNTYLSQIQSGRITRFSNRCGAKMTAEHHAFMSRVDSLIEDLTVSRQAPLHEQQRYALQHQLWFLSFEAGYDLVIIESTYPLRVRFGNDDLVLEDRPFLLPPYPELENQPEVYVIDLHWSQG